MIQVPNNILSYINAAASEANVDPKLLASFASIESNFNPNAKSGTNVRGLFQITGDTWRRYRPGTRYSTDPYEQAKTASFIIRDLYNKYNGNLDLIGIAYNAGSGVADKLVGKEINYENVRNATLRYFSSSKVDEVWYYPKKLKAAYGGELQVGKNIPYSPSLGSSNREPAPVSTGDVNITEPVDPNTPFFQSFDTNARKAISDMKSITEKVPLETLRSNLNHGKLAPLGKIMNANIGRQASIHLSSQSRIPFFRGR